MKQITLIKDGETWDLYIDDKGVLYIYDSDPRYGGYWSMFDSLKDAEEKGWRQFNE